MTVGGVVAGVDFAAPLAGWTFRRCTTPPLSRRDDLCRGLAPTALGSDDVRRMVVMDESWRMFSHIAIAAWMQQSFKVSRSSGDDERAGDAPPLRPRLGRRRRITPGPPRRRPPGDLASAGAAGSR